MIAITDTDIQAHAAPRETTRNMALDRARTFLTIVVLIHHAVIPYTFFGHTDPKQWIGFDAIVLANDSYFMAMFFCCPACSCGRASPIARPASSRPTA